MTTGWQGLGKWLAGRAKLALILPITLAMAATAADTVPQVILATPGSSGTGEAPSDVLPYHGDLWVTSWGDHRIERYVLKPAGASWRAGTGWQQVVNRQR